MFARRLLYVCLILGLCVWGHSVSGQEKLPDEAQKAVAALEQDVAAIMKKTDEEIKQREKQAEAEIQARVEKCVAALQALQDTLTKAGKLDEAVTVRERIKALKNSTVGVLPNPESLFAYRGMNGKVFYFEVTGGAGNWVYGTDIYTDDSRLASSAVHAGVLKAGEKGVVKVTILPGQPGYAGSSRNGITSSSWDGYGGSYKVERAVRFGALRTGGEAKP